MAVASGSFTAVPRGSLNSGVSMNMTLWLFAPALLTGCAANMQSTAHPGGPMPMSAMDMTAMCDMHKEMMSGKPSEQRQAMMAKHMQSMSPELQQRMQVMMQRCK
jgi:hypothetical protein